MDILQAVLGRSDYRSEHYPRVEGSCRWIEARDDFQNWRDPSDMLMPGENATPAGKASVFWVYANPGTGKTHLAAHVEDQLRQFQLECASYFFHVGDQSSKSLSTFVRSIARQMAMSNSFVREKLVSLCHEGLTFDKDDVPTIWTKIFKNGIFQVSN